jgi:hypothetical protein
MRFFAKQVIKNPLVKLSSFGTYQRKMRGWTERNTRRWGQGTPIWEGLIKYLGTLEDEEGC